MAAKTANVLARAVTPASPYGRDEMDAEAFDTMMQEGLSQAKAGHGYSLFR